MNLSDKVPQQKLLEILISTYKKGHETDIKIVDIIEDLKEQILSINTNYFKTK